MNEEPTRSMEKAFAAFDELNAASSRVHEGDFVFSRINFIWRVKGDKNLFHRELQIICQGHPIYKEETSPSSDFISELNGMIHMVATNPADKNGLELVFTAPVKVIDAFKADWPEAKLCKNSVPFFRDRGGSQFDFKTKFEEPPTGFNMGSIFALKEEQSWRDDLAQIIISDFVKLIMQTKTKLLSDQDIDSMIGFEMNNNVYDVVKHQMIEDYRDMFCNVEF